MSTFDPEKTAHHLFAAHRQRLRFENLAGDLAPTTVSEAYQAQDALADLYTPVAGAVAGLKIATTTKVMQELMGIDRPCAGIIFAKRVLASPARVPLAQFQHLGIECELACRIGRELVASTTPFTADTVRAYVSEIMPAFELIEDREADYKQTGALSLIADNCWNAGVVMGTGVPPGAATESVIEGVLTINDSTRLVGRTEDPFGALAWIANLAAERGRGLRAGMIVITGSVIATLPKIERGDRFRFELRGVGAVELGIG